MYELFFFLFAGFTVFLSIRLSYYADLLGKTSKVSMAFVGGIVLAGVTALPEFVTCLSSITMKNPYLAVGDILGSNFFNLFIVAFFDLLFFKHFAFHKIKRYHLVVYALLLINYVVFFLFAKGFLGSVFLRISIPTFVTFLTYLYYVRFISRHTEEEDETIEKEVRHVGLKLFICAFLMVISSILLTFIVNQIAHLYPRFSASLFGAILLGVTTSLPEVVTFYALFSLKNYDLALSNIIGSNLFNLFVLAVCDLFLPAYSIYQFYDMESLLLIKLGGGLMLLSILHFFLKKKKWYILFPILGVLIYIFFWIRHFA